MSGKDDSGLLGTNMLQKARSFRDDIKMKIRRSPSHKSDRSSVTSSSSQRSSSSSHKSPSSSHKSPPSSQKSPSSSHKSPKHKRRISRGTSFKEETRTEKRFAKTDIERLDTESKKVDHALLGLKVVTDGGWLHMLHGSATVVLEAVMEFKQLVESLIHDQESTILLSACKQVNVSLAALIQWADKVLLHGDGGAEKLSAETVIKNVNDGVKELHKISVEKIKNKCSPQSQTLKPKQSVRKQNSFDSSIQQTPLPLTPREKEILQQTSQFNYDAENTTHLSANSVSDAGVDTTDRARYRDGVDSAAKPPPKPPLPRTTQPGLLSQSIQKAIQAASIQDAHDFSSVPPLPPKRRAPSIASIYDNHIPDVDSPPQSPKPRVDAQDSKHSFNATGINNGHNSFNIAHTAVNYSPNSCNIDRSENDVNSTVYPGITVQFSRNSPKRTIPLHIQTDEPPAKPELKRTSPDRISNVSSISSRSSSFSLTTSASATSQTVVFPAGPGSTGSENSGSTVKERFGTEVASSVQGGIVSSSHKEEVSHVSASRSFVQSGVKSYASGGVENTQISSVLNVNTTPDSRLSHYDNFDKLIRDNHTEQFQNITEQIKQLTFGMANADSESPHDFGTPPLPQKTRPYGNNSGVDTLMQRTRQRFISRPTLISQYDNFGAQTNDVISIEKRSKKETASEIAVLTSENQQPVVLRGSRSAYEFAAQKSSATGNGYAQHQHTTVMKSSQTFSAVANFDGFDTSQDMFTNPPPLPPKRKNVESYMQIFGATAPSLPDMARQSINTMAHYQSQWLQHQLELHPMLSLGRDWMENPVKLPIIPQITNEQRESLSNRSNALSMMSDMSSGRGSDVFSVQSGSSEDYGPQLTPPFPSELPDKNSQSGGRMVPSVYEDVNQPMQSETPSEVSPVPAITQQREQDTDTVSATSQKVMLSNMEKKMDSGFAELTVLDDTEVSDQLIKNPPGSDEPEIRGGCVDALIVHAASVGVKEILYQEAFLTTYRTFITPLELVEKLLYRYNRFCQLDNVKKKKLASAAFSLLIRVVDDMCKEISESVLKILTDTVYQFLSEGSLMLAKILRRKIVEKVELKRQLAENSTHHLTLWEAHHMTTKQYSLLDFHARHIAEQMTLLDAGLFQKIEVPEVLQWPQYQNEEQSANLTQFTVHFNKMSYWCRTLILSQEDPKDREKILLKFIKIMKHLRRYNNFNSYLAILSAVDSAPVRRLEWQKQNVEALKEFCHLIDSSSSFRSYRQALGEAEPPCIPYIGIILQDLTFVHIGNPDKLPDGNINFSKRWQQFHILDNMKRFKKCNYEFKKDHKILAFFDGFEYSLSEESLWQISEDIKPRGGKKNLK